MLENDAILDVYDDGGQTLVDKCRDSIPDFIKEASMLTEEAIEQLPDHAFAVVLIRNGEKMRKLACVDKAHAALSALYLMERGKNLPYEARSVAAHNVKVACARYGLRVPKKLAKMSARTKRKLIDTDGAVPTVSKVKGAEISGTELAPFSPPKRYGGKRIKKLASNLVSPYVDVDRDTQPIPVSKVKMTYALDDADGPQFPLESYAQVKEAADFFAQQGKRFHPRRRHEACVKIAARADALGVPLSPDVRKYGSTTYGPEEHIKVGIQTRKQMFRSGDGGPSLLDSLMEKRASVSPEDFAEALAEVDIATGFSKYWDKSVLDPWATTFGQQKTAEWSWTHGNEKLNASQLKKFVKSGPGIESVQRSFGAEIAEAMQKDPTQIFDSLPLDQKIVIARLAYQE